MRDLYLARQPIYDRRQQVSAYEVLFRSSSENRAIIENAAQATTRLLFNTFIGIGLDRVVGPHPAFVNLPREFITGEQSLTVAPHRLVLEILEDVEIDDAVISGTKRLIDLGYTLALDDVVFEDRLIPLLELVKIVKVELPRIADSRLREHVQQFRDFDVQLLAEKVETQEQFEHCRELGFDLYQGYYFSRPQMISGRQPLGDHSTALRLLSELGRPDVSIDDVEQLVRRDPSLCLKLLRFINSAGFGLAREVNSVRQAVILLGTQGLRTLAMLIAMSGMTTTRPESLKTAMLRAIACERLGRLVPGCDPSGCFMAGIVSGLEVVLGVPIEELLKELPVSQEIREAVVERGGRFGAVLRCAASHEEPDRPLATLDALSGQDVRGAYLDAIAETEKLWAELN
jgi:EAL and modified HD-GYP domain-containing signal transduction protein